MMFNFVIEIILGMNLLKIKTTCLIHFFQIINQKIVVLIKQI